MSNKNSETLKKIGGVVLIDKDGTPKLCSLEDMQFSKHFTVGQLFRAVQVLNGKTIEQYGNKWPSYWKDKDNNVMSDSYKTLIENYNNKFDSDYDFLVEVCNQLGEEVPEVVARKTVLERLELYRTGAL